MFLIVSSFTCTRLGPDKFMYKICTAWIFHVFTMSLPFSLLFSYERAHARERIRLFAWTFCQFTQLFTVQKAVVLYCYFFFLLLLLYFGSANKYSVPCTMWEIFIVFRQRFMSFYAPPSLPPILFISCVCLVFWLFNVKNARMCLKAPCNATSFILSFFFCYCCNLTKDSSFGHVANWGTNECAGEEKYKILVHVWTSMMERHNTLHRK